VKKLNHDDGVAGGIALAGMAARRLPPFRLPGQSEMGPGINLKRTKDPPQGPSRIGRTSRSAKSLQVRHEKVPDKR